MAIATKRVAQSSVNWRKLSESLSTAHNTELARLKAQNSQFQAQVNQLPTDLPKVDFAALKKQLPDFASTIDSLQKQYEAIKIPYGEIPAGLNAEVDKWSKYNESRVKLHQLKTSDGAEEAKKVEEKWAKAPPVEHFNRQHFVEYFPQLFYDLRYQKRIPDPCEIGINENFHILKARFKDYKVLRRADKVDDH